MPEASSSFLLFSFICLMESFLWMTFLSSMSLITQFSFADPVQNIGHLGAHEGSFCFGLLLWAADPCWGLFQRIADDGHESASLECYDY